MTPAFRLQRSNPDVGGAHGSGAGGVAAGSGVDELDIEILELSHGTDMRPVGMISRAKIILYFKP
jgi:hypothetical protein